MTTEIETLQSFLFHLIISLFDYLDTTPTLFRLHRFIILNILTPLSVYHQLYVKMKKRTNL